jgi:heme-degrading monooxygenase HmoA
MCPFAITPEPPYYAVIFTSQRTSADEGYGETGDRMVELASAIPGFLGVEGARSEEGVGITVSYWASEEAIAAWKSQVEHEAAQAKGKQRWYQHYKLRVAKVERAYQGPAGR